MRRAVVLAVALAGLVPAGASAATVVREGDGTLVYTAAGAAKNHVGVQGSDDDSTITFYTNAGDAMNAPAGCTPSDLYGGDVVTCTTPTAVRVELGAGDDDAYVSDGIPVPVTLSGGPGADWLEAADEPGVLDGGTGEDKLVGGEGDDVLRGGDGNDTIEGKDGGDRIDAGAGDDLLSPDGYEHAKADVVDGGPGVDRIEGDYSSRFSDTDPPVAITFGGGADDGRPGEGDDLRSVEKVWLNVGGSFTGTEGADEFRLSQVGTASTMAGGGDDRLRSGDGPDRLDGGAGNDSVDGGFGDDELIGGPGRDTISGDLAGGDCGPLWCRYPYGNDTIQARDGEVDSITCGAGTDTVSADAQDVVAADCENVVRGASGSASTTGSGRARGASAKHAGGKVALRGRPRLAKALRSGFSVRVSGAKAGRRIKLTASRAGRLMARGSASVPAGATAVTVRLRFTPAARKALKRKHKATLVVSGGTVRGTVTLRR